MTMEPHESNVAERQRERRIRRVLRVWPTEFIAHDLGLTNRSIDGPMHVVVYDQTWCGGGVAYAGRRNVGGRICPRCFRLLVEEAMELVEDEDLDEAERKLDAWSARR